MLLAAIARIQNKIAAIRFSQRREAQRALKAAASIPGVQHLYRNVSDPRRFQLIEFRLELVQVGCRATLDLELMDRAADGAVQATRP